VKIISPPPPTGPGCAQVRLKHVYLHFHAGDEILLTALLIASISVQNLIKRSIIWSCIFIIIRNIGW